MAEILRKAFGWVINCRLIMEGMFGETPHHISPVILSFQQRCNFANFSLDRHAARLVLSRGGGGALSLIGGIGHVKAVGAVTRP